MGFENVCCRQSFMQNLTLFRMSITVFICDLNKWMSNWFCEVMLFDLEFTPLFSKFIFLLRNIVKRKMAWKLLMRLSINSISYVLLWRSYRRLIIRPKTKSRYWIACSKIGNTGIGCTIPDKIEKVPGPTENTQIVRAYSPEICIQFD